MKKYNALYFDVDNTLLDFSKAESVAIACLFEKFGIKSDAETVALYSKINLKYWEKYEKGEMEKPEILVARFRETMEILGEEKNAELLNETYFSLLSKCHFLIDGAYEILDYLKKKGYLIYATTNGISRTQYKRIRESGLEPFFEDIFVSETANAQKPTLEYYDYVLKNSVEKDKSKILIIGDSMTSDIKGGINFGVDTCWYNDKNGKKIFEPTYIIKSLSELKEIL